MSALLVMLGGRLGSGKSSLAEALAQEMDLAVVRSDLVRKELAGVTPEQALPASGYSAEASARTYAEVVARARGLLRAGCGVVLDATWSKAAGRETVRQMAGEEGAMLVEVVCVAPLEVLEARLGAPTAAGAFGSDADAGVMRMIPLEEWPEALTVETAWASPGELAAGVAQRLRQGLEETIVGSEGSL